MTQKRPSTVKFNMLLHLPHILRYVVIFVLILAVLCTGFFALRGCSRRRSTVADGGIEIRGATPTAQYSSMKNTFIAFDGSFARAYDAKKGTLLWEVSPDGTHGFGCAASSDLLALYKESMLYVYDREGRISYSTGNGNTGCCRGRKPRRHPLRG